MIQKYLKILTSSFALEYLNFRKGNFLISQIGKESPEKLQLALGHIARLRVEVTDSEEDLPSLQCFTVQRHISSL